MATVDFCTGWELRATAQLRDGFGESSGIGSQGPGVIVTTNQRSGARCWDSADTFGSNWYRRHLPQRATRVIAGAFRPSTIITETLLGFIYGPLDTVGASGQLNVCLNADGTFSAWRPGTGWWGNRSGGGATLLGTSTNFISTALAYHHIEAVATIDNSAGAIDVYIDLDPTPWLSLSGIDTQSQAGAFSDGFGVCGSNGANTVRWDDVYTADSRLSFPDQRVLGVGMSPGNGTLNGSTPLTGTDRGDMVDETTADDDTTYNIFDPTEVDSYNMPALGSTGTIRYFICWQRWKKNDYGGVGIKGGLRIGGVNYEGSERFIGTAQYENVKVLDGNVSPATGVALTEAELNTSETVADRST